MPVPDFGSRNADFYQEGSVQGEINVATNKTNVTLIGELCDSTISDYDDYAQKQNRLGENIGTSVLQAFLYLAMALPHTTSPSRIQQVQLDKQLPFGLPAIVHAFSIASFWEIRTPFIHMEQTAGNTIKIATSRELSTSSLVRPQQFLIIAPFLQNVEAILRQPPHLNMYPMGSFSSTVK